MVLFQRISKKRTTGKQENNQDTCRSRALYPECAKASHCLWGGGDFTAALASAVEPLLRCHL